ncbi:hypothetical protein [Chitinophaga sp. ARDCPP14]|uniref:WD40/YVTN/BNR-like repeat-containing protein n=1 Tax=Chitinophaga sp. ARDCPP14 TaxID=3391139 RepID=UPI003F526D5B
MKLLYLFLIFTLLTVPLSAQLPGNPVYFKSGAQKLGVSSCEQLIITSRAGEIVMADSIQGYWRSVLVNTNPKKPITRLNIERATFFNRDTGFISGFIAGSSGKYDIIYRTTDFGKSWTVVDVGKSGWMDGASWLDNGEAWLTVSGNGIVHTADFGATWDGMNLPGWGNSQRYDQLFFTTGHEGITGSVWNILALFHPETASWEKIPTPLDQKAYAKTNIASRPSIAGVAIYKDYLLANQEGLVFYSRKDSVNWIPLPDYDNFYTDAANTALYFHGSNGQFVKADDQLQPVFNYNTAETYYDAVCKNTSLFILYRGRMMQLKADRQVITANMYTMDTTVAEPEMIGSSGKENFGILGNEILVQKGKDDSWKHYLTLPISAGNIAGISMSNSVIKCNSKNDSLYTYNISTRSEAMKSNTDIIRDFCMAGIKTITFTSGSQGCDQQTYGKLMFRKTKGGFEAVEAPSSSTYSSQMITDVSFIDEAPVLNFINNIPSLPGKQTTIQQLNFSEEDYAQCKSDILTFKRDINNNKLNIYANNLNFEKLLSIVDSVKNIDPALLNNMLLNMEDIVSTTSFTKGLILVNQKDEVMSLYHGYYETYNPWLFPWRFHINGVHGMSNAIEISEFIRKVYPSFLSRPDKITALRTIVKNLYMIAK